MEKAVLQESCSSPKKHLTALSMAGNCRKSLSTIWPCSKGWFGRHLIVSLCLWQTSRFTARPSGECALSIIICSELKQSAGNSGIPKLPCNYITFQALLLHQYWTGNRFYSYATIFSKLEHFLLDPQGTIMTAFCKADSKELLWLTARDIKKGCQENRPRRNESKSQTPFISCFWQLKADYLNLKCK